MSEKSVAETKTGIGELKEKTIDYYNLIKDVKIAIPYADKELRKQLSKMSLSLTELLETLKNYA